MWRSLAVLVLAVSPTALAAAEFYAGVGVGESVEGGRYSQPLTEFGVQADDTAGKAFAGGLLSSKLAVEASYYDFGARICCPSLADAGFATDLEGVAAALVGRLPFERLTLFAKAGALVWRENGHEITIAGPQPLSADGVAPALGVGALLEVAGTVSIGVEWESFEVAGDSLSGFWLSARIGF